MMGRTLLSLTTPHPTGVQGAMGEIGVGPDSGSQVLNDGYHPETVSYTHLTLPTICSV